jgi:hypothetical protein
MGQLGHNSVVNSAVDPVGNRGPARLSTVTGRVEAGLFSM